MELSWEVLLLHVMFHGVASSGGLTVLVHPRSLTHMVGSWCYQLGAQLGFLATVLWSYSLGLVNIIWASYVMAQRGSKSAC